jgi:Holliday junction DNA helicase RuvA
VGRKTAARLLVELESRLELPERDSATVAVGGGNGTGSPDVRTDVRVALEGLGYGPTEIRAALSDLPESDESSELLREALRRLAGGV